MFQSVSHVLVAAIGAVVQWRDGGETSLMWEG